MTASRTPLKISTALGLAFAVVIVLGIIVASIGSLQLRRIASEVNLLTEDRMVKVAQIRSIKDNLNIQAQDLLQAVSVFQLSDIQQQLNNQPASLRFRVSTHQHLVAR